MTDSVQVLLPKFFFDQARAVLKKRNPMFGGMAVSLCQDAIEAALILYADKTKCPGIRDKESFPSLIDKLEIHLKGALEISLPFKNRILSLNHARVGFKHKGNIPPFGEAERFVLLVHEFLSETYQELLKLDFDSVSMVSLVQNKDLREHLNEAEVFCQNHEYKQAIISIGKADAVFMSLIKNTIPIGEDLRHADTIMERIVGDQCSWGREKWTQKLNHSAVILSYAAQARVAVDSFLPGRKERFCHAARLTVPL